MPRLTTETFGTGDQSWLGSTHSIYECRSVAPDPDAFTGSDFTNGVPSGTPLSIVDGTAVLFDGDAPLAGFLYADRKVDDGSWPLLDHGKVRVDRLPAPFRDDVSSAAAEANPNGLILFIDRDNVTPDAGAGGEG